MEAARNYDGLSEVDLAARASARDGQAIRFITTHYNQRLFRAAWSVLRDRSDAEEAVQDAYAKAFTVGRFEGRSSLGTWLTRIVINEALSRKRANEARKRSLADADVTQIDDYREKLMSVSFYSPEFQMLRGELARAIETAIARLPEEFRTVLVLRDIEDMSVEETAEALDILAATVKTRHLRARRRLRQEIDPDFRAVLAETLRFDGENCERMTARAVAALTQQ
ncbi:MAG: RNA polymerase sigma factor [Proteobacteria bacterium]|nr:RNA polymerase sigma factor [Pseudomonadota bacterium]